MTIGILALQGDFEAHRHTLQVCGASLPALHIVTVREAADLEPCDGLVIPGGESTTMSRLCDRYGLWEPLQQKLQDGMGAFGTCAGLIFLAKNITGATKNFEQKTLGALDIDVARNAYGAQVDSFEADIKTGDEFDGEPLHGVFIRAPRITRCGDVQVLAELNGEPVAVRHGNVVAASFHPEIAGETRLHRLWLDSLTTVSPRKESE
jgi:5'-phosphate synthase pdxT subunit